MLKGLAMIRLGLLLSVLLGSLIGWYGGSSPLHGSEPGGVTVTTSGRANVRYGPSLEARVITTLDAGAEVQVFGPAEGREGWYTIGFPRAGHAWVHDSVVQVTDDERWLRVTRDGANVRSDSRISADLVTQLSYGELVEYKGRQVGNWLAIHPPGARAYVFRSVLNLSPEAAQALEQRSLLNDANQRRWQLARLRYEHYRQIFTTDQARSLRLDWAGLNGELAAVATDHPTVRTRLLAQRLQGSIKPVVSASSRYQRDHGLRPLPDPEFRLPQPVVAQLPAAPPRQPEAAPPHQPEAAATRQPEAAAPRQPEPSQAPEAERRPEAPVSEAEAVAVIADTRLEEMEAAPVVAGAPQLIGWIEQRDDPGVGSSFALIDGQGEVAAFIKPVPGSDFRLSDFFWRRVELRGSSTPTTVTIGGTRREILVVEATSVRLAD
ncbi:MAG: hypothetical protein EA402_09470 [Planctomycetota bacterium]|nr:MAG: hypothetical protein EA402_09470 [Planctomycetota bacterium]